MTTGDEALHPFMRAPLAFSTKGGTCWFTFDERTVCASKRESPPYALIFHTPHHSALHSFLAIRSLISLESEPPTSRCPITTADPMTEVATTIDHSARRGLKDRRPSCPQGLCPSPLKVWASRNWQMSNPDTGYRKASSLQSGSKTSRPSPLPSRLEPQQPHYDSTNSIPRRQKPRGDRTAPRGPVEHTSSGPYSSQREWTFRECPRGPPVTTHSSYKHSARKSPLPGQIHELRNSTFRSPPNHSRGSARDPKFLDFAGDRQCHFDIPPTKAVAQHEDFWIPHEPSKCGFRSVGLPESECCGRTKNDSHSIWSIELVPYSKGAVAVPRYMGQVEGDTYEDEQTMPEWNTIMKFAKRLENVDLGTEGRMKWKTMNTAMEDICNATAKTVEDPESNLLSSDLQASRLVTISQLGTEFDGSRPQESRWVWCTLAPAEI